MGNTQGSETVKLYRGTNSKSEFDAIQLYSTAGGWAEGKDSGTLPSKSAVEKQKGTSGECAPITKAVDVSKFTPWVEYTKDPAVAKQFGEHRGGVVTVTVKKSQVYDVVGDPMESGVFLHRSTRVTVIK